MSKSPADKSMRAMQLSSFLDGSNALYIEELYEQYLTDPNSIDAEWHAYFSQLAAENTVPDVAHTPIRESFRNIKSSHCPNSTGAVSPHELLLQEKQVRVAKLINAYRAHGHRIAKINPLNTEESDLAIPELTLDFQQLTRGLRPYL